MLGNGRLEAQCFDGEKRLAHIRGKMRKKVWIGQGDIILLSLRDFQDEKADVILKYTADEARSLKQMGELPESAKINETDMFGPEDEDVSFDFEIDEASACRVTLLDYTNGCECACVDLRNGRQRQQRKAFVWRRYMLDIS